MWVIRAGWPSGCTSEEVREHVSRRWPIQPLQTDCNRVPSRFVSSRQTAAPFPASTWMCWDAPIRRRAAVRAAYPAEMCVYVQSEYRPSDHGKNKQKHHKFSLLREYTRRVLHCSPIFLRSFLQQHTHSKTNKSRVDHNERVPSLERSTKNRKNEKEDCKKNERQPKKIKFIKIK